MRCSWCLFYFLFFTLSTHIVRTAPPDYCLLPLNRSDCNMAPKTVYSYYKPGSRCEREMWRGCPTANKFDNEYLCSLNCIFRMRQNDPVDFDPCNIPLNQSICGEQKFVITHEKGYCKRAWWGGCPTYNIFDDVHKCVEACNGIPLEVHTVSLEKINELLKVVIENEFRTTTEQETETESTTETDSDTESITTEEITTEEITTEEITTEEITTEEITTAEITTEEITIEDTTTDESEETTIVESEEISNVETTTVEPEKKQMEETTIVEPEKITTDIEADVPEETTFDTEDEEPDKRQLVLTTSTDDNLPDE